MTRILAVAALLSAAPAPLHAQCTDADRAALEALDKSWGEAGQRGDRSYLDALYAGNFVGHSIAGPVDKTTTLANTMRSAELNKINPQPLAIPDRYLITCTARTATITHRAMQPASNGGIPSYGRSIHFLERVGNRWQVVSTTGHLLDDTALLTYMELEWNDAIRRHDGTWLEANYAPFGIEVSSRTGLLENKAALIASAKADKRIFDALEMSDVNVRVEGDAAVVTGINHARGKDGDGKPFDRRIRFTDTFIKRDGRWQVWASQGTPIQ